MTPEDRQTIATKLQGPLRLTLAGLWAERLARGFWPLWSLLLGLLALLSLGVQDLIPRDGLLALAALVAVLALWSGIYGWRNFRRPLMAEAMVRLDSSLPGRPLSALADRQVIGATDAASRAVWEAHLRRMAARAATARPVAPDLRLSRRDPYGLRYLALTAAVVALTFGSLWRIGSVTGVGAGPAQALIGGPTWEGWVQPPAYTGKPSLYLNDIDLVTFSVPVGSRVQIRFYGEVGALSVAESVSGRSGDVPPATDPVQDFSITQSGSIGIEGPNARRWNIVALRDAPPEVSATGEVTRESDGRMKLQFSAKDDYGVTGGRAVIALDLPEVDRRHGLTIDPEPVDPVMLDLPLPITGNRVAFDETLIDDLSKHVLANLPVTVALSVTDAPG
ncbi:MAG: DUF4175 family protein, partial [Pseudorhodobacter sp.]